MNARMSKLRRSISRSVFQLNSSLSRQNSLNGLVDLPTMSNTTLVDKFATPTNFRQLRDVIRNNNELLAEVVAAFEEKAALDFHYSKTLKKISIRLHKLTQSVESGIDKGWTNVAEQFDIHATIHSNLGSALTEDIIQPLRSIHTSQQKTIRAADNFVEREIRKLKDKKEETQKMKRSLYVLSKELEKTENAAEREKMAPEKYALRRKKYKEQMIRSEDDYVWQTVDLEKQRRMTENVLRKGVESMESVERQRLAHCQTALGRYKRKIENLGPNLRQMFERHSNNLELAVDSVPEDYIQTIQPSTSAVNHITLIDLHAENFGEVMSSTRRRQNLERVSGVLDSELKRMYNNQTADVMVSNSKQISVLEFIEYLYYKINDSINIVDGGQNRGFHRLARFQHKIKDKSGLAMTILTIPLTGENNSLPPPSLSLEASTAYPSPHGSNDYEEYEKISDDGFYSTATTNTSSSGGARTTTTFNESTSNSPTICRVLYDFEPKHSDEIQIREGQCVLVEDRIGEDWLIGHVISQPDNSSIDPRSGRFPTTYVSLRQ
ncbi:hypothetical protein GCK72_008830 [Caenorhabditis remanei]|uniref:Uncharacterized protein n=1 Tax=Caenorhabditis remanei TaxID=31234 RepID=A0A2P4V5J6_CAERE|nr:hypothetical protein GCK72_008830 [Caenorhabditis remanei]KAF1760581.1 hypothetical protein GCK72_008830 [Caenorhabditis remanei]